MNANAQHLLWNSNILRSFIKAIHSGETEKALELLNTNKQLLFLPFTGSGDTLLHILAYTTSDENGNDDPPIDYLTWIGYPPNTITKINNFLYKNIEDVAEILAYETSAIMELKNTDGFTPFDISQQHFLETHSRSPIYKVLQKIVGIQGDPDYFNRDLPFFSGGIKKKKQCRRKRKTMRKKKKMSKRNKSVRCR